MVGDKKSLQSIGGWKPRTENDKREEPHKSGSIDVLNKEVKEFRRRIFSGGSFGRDRLDNFR